MSRPDPASSSQHWQEVQRLFHGALARPTEERAAWLAAATGRDAALHGKVAAMLAADAEPDALLDRAPADLLGMAVTPAAPPAAGDSLAAGGRVGSYRIERAVGRGGMGVVYLAHDERTGEAVALKVLRPVVAEALAAGESRRRFLREIRLGARVTHPGLVPVLDSGETDGRLWLAMPFLDGETLHARLKRERRLPLGVAVTIGRQIAEALAWLAAEGIVHRDVKPDNVLLARDASGGADGADGAIRAVLADFGIARALDLADVDGRLTVTGVLLGTVRYMSPEQMRGEPIEPQTDVFALGVVLYEMLAGEPPFRGPAQRALLRHGPGRTVAMPDVRRVRGGIPDAVADAILGALSPDARDRPTSADMARVLAAAPTTAGA